MVNETWKFIKGFENYQVSNLGNVRSIDRIVKGKNNTIRRIKGKTKAQFMHKGYLNVELYKGNKRTHKKVHRLVLEAFSDKTSALDVNHIDGNKTNNNINNLEYCTRKDNLLHAVHNRLNKQSIPIIAIKGKEQIKSDSIANFYRIIKDKIKISCKEKTFRENVRRALNPGGIYYGYSYKKSGVV